MAKLTTLHIKLACCFLFIIAIPFEVFFEHDLEKQEKKIITSMQEGEKEEVKNAMWVLWICSYLASPYSVCGLINLLYVLWQPMIALKFAIVFYLTTYSVIIVQLIFHEPCPFWQFSDIKVLICDASFSYPDLNSFIITFSVLYLRKFSQFKPIHYALSLCYILYIMISGQYLGLSYLHQIIFSWAYAWVAYFICLQFDYYVQRLTKRSGFKYKTHRHYIIYWFVSVIALIVFSIIIYNLVNDYEKSIQWMINYKKAVKDCQITYSFGYEYTIGYSFSFVQAGIIGGILGCVIGAMNTDKLLGREAEGWWVNQKMWVILVRAIIVIAVSVACFIWIIWVKFPDVPSYFTFSYFAPFGICHYICFGWLPSFFNKYINSKIEEEQEENQSSLLKSKATLESIKSKNSQVQGYSLKSSIEQSQDQNSSSDSEEKSESQQSRELKKILDSQENKNEEEIKDSTDVFDGKLLLSP